MRELVGFISALGVALLAVVYMVALPLASTQYFNGKNCEKRWERRIDYVFPYRAIGCWFGEKV